MFLLNEWPAVALGSEASSTGTVHKSEARFKNTVFLQLSLTIRKPERVFQHRRKQSQCSSHPPWSQAGSSVSTGSE